MDTLHFAAALLEQDNGIVQSLLQKLGIAASALALSLDRELERLPKVAGSVDSSKIYVTQALNEVFTRADE